MPKKPQSSSDRLNKIVAGAQRNQLQREQAYREQALKLYPWICGRCQREFTRENLQELTVHHRWQQLGAVVYLLPRQRTPAFAGSREPGQASPRRQAGNQRHAQPIRQPQEPLEGQRVASTPVRH